jgi:hypothetical protein
MTLLLLLLLMLLFRRPLDRLNELSRRRARANREESMVSFECCIEEVRWGIIEKEKMGRGYGRL